MTEEPETVLSQWLTGDQSLTFDEVEAWRAKLLAAHQRGERTPHSHWWKLAEAGTPGALYRDSAEKLIRDYELTALKDAAGENRMRAWLRLRSMDTPTHKIAWGKRQLVYVRWADVPALISDLEE